jgi:hypothetical protein
MNDDARTIPLGLIPPVWLGNCFIRTRIARNGSHYLKIVGLYYLLDHLDALQVTQHVSNRTHIFTMNEKKRKDFHLPDGTNSVTVDYGLRHLERLFNLILRSRGNWLFDKQGSFREVPQDLELDIAARTRGTTEHGGRTNDDGTRTFLLCHIFDKVLESLVDASVLICGTYECLALLAKDCGGTVNRGVDEGDYFETGAELTKGPGAVREMEGGARAEKTHCSKRKEWFQGPSSDPMGQRR